MTPTDKAREETARRFWALVEKTPTCWTWKGTRNAQGYGRHSVRGKTTGTHRVAWELTIGPIPKGMHVCHRCDNPPCVRPEHLFLGTAKDNAQDCKRKGRVAHNWGESHGEAKLTVAKVVEIRTRFDRGEPMFKLAKECGVAKSVVADVIHGFSWQRAGGPIHPRKPGTKLTPEAIADIRARLEVSPDDLARQYGVSVTSIKRVRVGLRDPQTRYR